jgi:hypothetical protein
MSHFSGGAASFISSFEVIYDGKLLTDGKQYW